MKEKRKERRLEAGIFLLILAALAVCVVRCEYPGLYLDAVNPDYYAVQLLFSKPEHSDWLPAHSFFPLLGQLYHGTVTLMVQMLGIWLTGSPSALLLRSLNAVYAAAICFLIYKILKDRGVGGWINAGTVALLLLGPQVFSFIRTQYYIKLPGTLLLLFAYFWIGRIGTSKEKYRHLLGSGILAGLAFYSYFIYLFFAPALWGIVYLRLKREKRSGQSLIWLIGFLIGCIPYFTGYFDLLLTSLGTGLPLLWRRGIIGDFLLAQAGFGIWIVGRRGAVLQRKMRA